MPEHKNDVKTDNHISFDYGDHDLARRRLLDLAYDCSDRDLLKESIDWSSKFEAGNSVPQAWIDAGKGLLARLSQIDLVADHSGVLFYADTISKKYRKGNFALENIALQLYPGELVGVVGENGNGKTTLLRSIAGYLNAGINEDNYTYIKKDIPFHYQLKSQTGFIPQRIPRWFGKLHDNLRFTASIHSIEGDDNDLMVDFVLERFGLRKFAQLTWKQISSGYRTRFEIARLILQRPAVLILDEPLANLDILAQQTLLQDLRYIAKSKRHPMGVILTSQQLYEVEKVADRVLFIKNGLGKYRVVEENGALTVFELETQADRELISKSLSGMFTELRFNGGVYEIHTEHDLARCIGRLLESEIPIQYFRDITNSTKRFF